MGVLTEIAWTDHTFNPWWGCQRVSPGCEHCYAETFSKRVGLKVWGPTSDRRFFGEKHWNDPIKWNREALKAGVRRRVFCASMADVFEDRRDLDPWRIKLWRLIEDTPDLDWQLLTKRPENMLTLASECWRGEWPDNIWAGTTAEDQAHYDRRWPKLAMVPARVHFISHEPALGPIEIHEALGGDDSPIFPDWVITGGESGPGARPYEIRWARNLSMSAPVDTAVFVKQMGSHALWNGARLRFESAKGGDPSEWPESGMVGGWPREFPFTEASE